MTVPFIGITTYGQDEQKRFTLPREYVDSVRRTGAVPVLITPGESNFDQLFAHLDGLILAGGGDISPTCYQGEMHETIYMLDEERDSTEMDLAKYILNKGIPTLGICRGTQILNVVLGGTLHPHLPDVFGEEINHRLPPREPTPHPVKIKEDSMLAQIVGSTDCKPASWHHQSINELGEGLEIVAHAPDGVIEAVELKEHPWLIAVQWHPEITSAEDPTQQNIFDGFVKHLSENNV